MKIKVNGVEVELESLKITGNPPEEQELTVVATNDTKTATFYTSDNCYLTKFKKLIAANPCDWRITDLYYKGDVLTGVRVRAPKKYISFRAGGGTPRVLTEEQKNALRERMKNVRPKKSS